MLYVCELFKSIQGESTFSGEICSFIRLSGCNLNCSYCDTEYAKKNKKPMSIKEIINWVNSQNCSLVEITGGEPLIQQETPLLAKKLCEKGYNVLIETNGSQDINKLPKKCIRIVDIKCPGSEEENSFYLPNVNRLKKSDQCKFVITNYDDFIWACNFINNHNLLQICTVIFSPAYNILPPKNLAEWILEKNIQVRFGIQLHKYIWPLENKGR
jgi:7-carboxy-7-deazaguanine synthase